MGARRLDREAAVDGDRLVSQDLHAAERKLSLDIDGAMSDATIYLNGKPTYLKGVCMHHDLGPLGSAFHIEAAERQVRILKEMDCNSIRTAHNPPAPGLVELCDRMGVLLQIEAFDTWDKPKRGNDDARSSYFGIIDLCGFPKDRFYLYQSRWRPELPMAHLLPHWNWPERVGELTPVHVYTSGDEAELFLNGKSLGRKKKGREDHRLIRDEMKYQPGEHRVTKAGPPKKQRIIRAPHNRRCHHFKDDCAITSLLDMGAWLPLNHRDEKNDPIDRIGLRHARKLRHCRGRLCLHFQRQGSDRLEVE